MTNSNTSSGASSSPEVSFEDLLKAIAKALPAELLRKIQNQEATAADLNVARQMLKDYGIQGNVKADPSLLKLADEVPFREVG